MKKLESSLTNMALVLTGVAVIMGGILAFVNHLTEGPINEQKTKALADGIKSVMVCNALVVASDFPMHWFCRTCNQNCNGRTYAKGH